MKHLLSILLICSIGFTQELTVDGNLNVTGNIQNQTIDSLQQVIAGLQSQIAAMQGSGRLETRVFTIENIQVMQDVHFEIDLEQILGFEVDYALLAPINVEYISGTGNVCPNIIGGMQSINLCINTDGTWYIGSADKSNIYASNLDWQTWYGDNLFNNNLYIRASGLGALYTFNLTLAITADFSNAPTYQAPAAPQN